MKNFRDGVKVHGLPGTFGVHLFSPVLTRVHGWGGSVFGMQLKGMRLADYLAEEKTSDIKSARLSKLSLKPESKPYLASRQEYPEPRKLATFKNQFGHVTSIELHQT